MQPSSRGAVAEGAQTWGGGDHLNFHLLMSAFQADNIVTSIQFI